MQILEFKYNRSQFVRRIAEDIMPFSVFSFRMGVWKFFHMRRTNIKKYPYIQTELGKEMGIMREFSKIHKAYFPPLSRKLFYANELVKIAEKEYPSFFKEGTEIWDIIDNKMIKVNELQYIE